MLSHLSAVSNGVRKNEAPMVTGLESAKACEQGHAADLPQKGIRVTAKLPPCPRDTTSQDRSLKKHFRFLLPSNVPRSKI